MNSNRCGAARHLGVSCRIECPDLSGVEHGGSPWIKAFVEDVDDATSCRVGLGERSASWVRSERFAHQRL